jgi:predicted nucleic acid-binding Zn ribbon protein
MGFADALLDRDAAPAPRRATTAMPQNKRELEDQFRQLGFSRAVAARMTGAAWAARQGGNDAPELDLSAVAAVLEANFSALKPYS